MVSRDGVGWAECFGFVDCTHVFCEGVGAGEGAVALWELLAMIFVFS